jgi:hypothetical protein
VEVSLTGACSYAVLVISRPDVVDPKWDGLFVNTIMFAATFRSGPFFDSFDRMTPTDGSLSLGSSIYGNHQWWTGGTSGGTLYADGQFAHFGSTAGSGIVSVHADQNWAASDAP